MLRLKCFFILLVAIIFLGNSAALLIPLQLSDPCGFLLTLTNNNVSSFEEALTSENFICIYDHVYKREISEQCKKIQKDWVYVGSIGSSPPCFEEQFGEALDLYANDIVLLEYQDYNITEILFQKENSKIWLKPKSKDTSLFLLNGKTVSLGSNLPLASLQIQNHKTVLMKNKNFLVFLYVGNTSDELINEWGISVFANKRLQELSRIDILTLLKDFHEISRSEAKEIPFLKTSSDFYFYSNREENKIEFPISGGLGKYIYNCIKFPNASFSLCGLQWDNIRNGGVAAVLEGSEIKSVSYLFHSENVPSVFAYRNYEFIVRNYNECESGWCVEDVENTEALVGDSISKSINGLSFDVFTPYAQPILITCPQRISYIESSLRRAMVGRCLDETKVVNCKNKFASVLPNQLSGCIIKTHKNNEYVLRLFDFSYEIKEEDKKFPIKSLSLKVNKPIYSGVFTEKEWGCGKVLIENSNYKLPQFNVFFIENTKKQPCQQAGDQPQQIGKSAYLIPAKFTIGEGKTEAIIWQAPDNKILIKKLHLQKPTQEKQKKNGLQILDEVELPHYIAKKVWKAHPNKAIETYQLFSQRPNTLLQRSIKARNKFLVAKLKDSNLFLVELPYTEFEISFLEKNIQYRDLKGYTAYISKIRDDAIEFEDADEILLNSRGKRFEEIPKDFCDVEVEFEIKKPPMPLTLISNFLGFSIFPNTIVFKNGVKVNEEKKIYCLITKKKAKGKSKKTLNGLVFFDSNSKKWIVIIYGFSEAEKRAYYEYKLSEIEKNYRWIALFDPNKTNKFNEINGIDLNFVLSKDKFPYKIQITKNNYPSIFKTLSNGKWETFKYPEGVDICKEGKIELTPQIGKTETLFCNVYPIGKILFLKESIVYFVPAIKYNDLWMYIDFNHLIFVNNSLKDEKIEVKTEEKWLTFKFTKSNIKREIWEDVSPLWQEFKPFNKRNSIYAAIDYREEKENLVYLSSEMPEVFQGVAELNNKKKNKEIELELVMVKPHDAEKAARGGKLFISQIKNDKFKLGEIKLEEDLVEAITSKSSKFAIWSYDAEFPAIIYRKQISQNDEDLNTGKLFLIAEDKLQDEFLLKNNQKIKLGNFILMEMDKKLYIMSAGPIKMVWPGWSYRLSDIISELEIPNKLYIEKANDRLWEVYVLEKTGDLNITFKKTKIKDPIFERDLNLKIKVVRMNENCNRPENYKVVSNNRFTVSIKNANKICFWVDFDNDQKPTQSKEVREITSIKIQKFEFEKTFSGYLKILMIKFIKFLQQKALSFEKPEAKIFVNGRECKEQITIDKKPYNAKILIPKDICQASDIIIRLKNKWIAIKDCKLEESEEGVTLVSKNNTIEVQLKDLNTEEKISIIWSFGWGAMVIGKCNISIEEEQKDKRESDTSTPVESHYEEPQEPPSEEGYPEERSLEDMYQNEKGILPDLDTYVPLPSEPPFEPTRRPPVE